MASQFAVLAFISASGTVDSILVNLNARTGRADITLRFS